MKGHDKRKQVEEVPAQFDSSSSPLFKMWDNREGV